MPPALMHFLLTMQSLVAWLFLLTIVFVPLELALGVQRQSVFRKGLLADIGYYFLTGLIPAMLLVIPLGAIAAVGRHALPPAYFLWIIGLPVWAQLLIALSVGEFGFYWGHRIMHQVPWLWKYHATHHEPERMDWLVNTRAHPVDITFTRLCGLSLVSIAGFGAPGSGSGSMMPVIVLLISTFWSFVIHANLRIRLGWLEYVVSSPRFHHWHHSRVDHINRNYASTLPIYDIIFGTHYLPAKQWPPSYGIAPENQPDVLIAAQYGTGEEIPPPPPTNPSRPLPSQDAPSN